MSDPKEPFSAGERLSPARREPPRQPPRQPPRGSGNGEKKPRKNGFFRRLAGFFVFGLYRLVFIGIVGGLIACTVGYFVFSADLPSVDSLKHYHPPLETRIYANNFKLISEVGAENRIYVPYDQIPPVVANAFISAEDRLFWVNPGINPFAIIRAGLTDLTLVGSGRRPLGASTITEQVVKNMLLDNHITFATKIKEAILAIRVSQVMAKQQILTLYLNEIFLGDNAYGVAAAAQAYFGKPLSQLDIAEAASLASLPKAPTTYNPFLHPQDALQRRNFVISRMLDDGVITPAQAAAATSEPLLPRAGAAPRILPDAGYFADAVHATLVQRFGATTVSEGGLIVHTSLNPTLQTAATEAVRDELVRYDHAHDGWHGLVGHVDEPDLISGWSADLARQTPPSGMRPGWQLGIVLQAAGSAARIGFVDTATNNPQIGVLPLDSMLWARPRLHDYLGPRPASVADVLHPGDIIMISRDMPDSNTLALEQIPLIQGALLSIDARTGRVIAMVGGWSHNESPYNRAIQAQRQPGSSVKPFVYLTAMEQGIQPDAPVLDAPFVQRMPNGTVYRPGNYEDTFEGPVPIYHALEQSLNLATLHLAREIGLTNIAKNFESFGIVDQMPPYYPSAIGAIDTTLWRMTTGYAELDNYGRQVTPTMVDSVTNPDGSILYQAPGQNCANCVNGNPDQPPVRVFSGAQLADPDSVFQMITMMRGVVLRGTGQPAVIGISQPIAGKTGTTNDFNDAWFMGFSRGIVTGCWTGYDTPTSLGNNQTGAEVCGPIWNAYMKVALKGQPDLDFPVPSGDTLEQTSWNGQAVTEAYKAGQTPGAQSTDSLLAGESGLTPQDSGIPSATPGTAGAPGATVPTTATAPAQPVGNNLGGLY
jgi:penicillin-binding protein 1A